MYRPNTIIVYFALETTGLSKYCDVVQIALRCADREFSTYIRSNRPIDPRATSVHGISNEGGILRVHGQRVRATTLFKALSNILQFLSSFNRPVTLVGYNAYRYEAPRLLRVIKICQLEHAYSYVVWNFVDACLLFRRLFPYRRGLGVMRLSSLAHDLLAIDPEPLYDAAHAVFSLQQLADRYLNYYFMVHGAIPFYYFLMNNNR